MVAVVGTAKDKSQEILVAEGLVRLNTKRCKTSWGDCCYLHLLCLVLYVDVQVRLGVGRVATLHGGIEVFRGTANLVLPNVWASPKYEFWLIATTEKLCTKHSKMRVSFQFIYVTIIGWLWVRPCLWYWQIYVSYRTSGASISTVYWLHNCFEIQLEEWTLNITGEKAVDKFSS